VVPWGASPKRSEITLFAASIISKEGDMLPLTKQERRVILFLMVVVLSGTGINYVRKQSVFLRTIFCINASCGKVNINTADKEMLKEIPGIGDTLAQRIIDFRAENGRFEGIDGLRKVKGLNGARYDRIKEAITAE
jgi:competence ComEA-like helix-hairpin-helix protein